MNLKNDTNYIQILPLHTNFIDLNDIYNNLTVPFQQNVLSARLIYLLDECKSYIIENKVMFKGLKAAWHN